MARRGVVRGAAEKQRLLDELKASGSSVAAFARERGLSAWTIYAWRRQAREEAGPQSSFVELQVVSEPRAPSTIELELPAGIRLRVAAGFDEHALRRLLGVLASC